jgi:Fe-S oxidoreductase
MCPSYRVTHDEEHSTRGRARLLFEMLEGDPLTGGWRDEHVKEALDLCLACKGCKSDCPVKVDMATYKSEFLSHYYEGRIRPPAAYAMGFIHVWARLASLAPRLANGVTQTPGLSNLAKAVAGISQRRTMPRFADRTFVEWFRSRKSHASHTWDPTLVGFSAGPSTNPAQAGSHIGQRQRVLLWPDTFNNHFRPDTAVAATEVLEAAGCDVVLPSRPLCCGRPLYDYGFLPTAKRLLRDILDELGPQLETGTPIVVLEPSCLAVFRDELVNLFPGDANAKRLAGQSYLLAEFLKKLPGYQPVRFPERVIMHGHCHHKAVAAIEEEEDLLKAAAISVEMLDSGCCGMAGSFGFEASHYDVSMKVGELVLLPAVRRAAAGTLIVADGFSCREQIEQATGRRAVHLAHALHAALRGHLAIHGEPAEDAILPPRRPKIFPRELAAAAVLLGAGITLAALVLRRR